MLESIYVSIVAQDIPAFVLYLLHLWRTRVIPIYRVNSMIIALAKAIESMVMPLSSKYAS